MKPFSQAGFYGTVGTTFEFNYNRQGDAGDAYLCTYRRQFFGSALDSMRIRIWQFKVATSLRFYNYGKTNVQGW